MRIKLQTEPPLPPLKAWLNIHSESTILQLKHSIRTKIEVIHNVVTASSDLVLLLDDFQLLDNIEIDVIRDGDCVSIRKLNGPPKQVTPFSNGHGPQKVTGTSSSSDSSSTPDSESESESESDSSTSPSPESVQHPPIPSRIHHSKVSSFRPVLPQTHVPPGHGKAATHSRNLRRRKKKTYDKLAAEVDDDTNPNSIPINTPLQVQAISEPVESTPPDGEQSFMMSSLSNKNKRRGFKAAMASTRPQKIIFADHSSPGPKTLPYFEGPSTVPSVAATTSRLISPSEKQEKGLIARNMFITSVDVEEHLPPTAKRRKRTHDYVSNDETNETSSGLVKKSDVQTVDLIEPGLASTSQSWGEENWQKGSKVETRSQVEVGKYLGWKELGIHPTSFTPEILLNVGRVVSCEEKVSLQAVHGASVVGDQFGSEGENDASLPDELMVYEWTHVLSNDWRIVSPSDGY